MRYPGHSQLYMGPGRVLYCGPLQHLDTHVYGADVLHVGMHGPFRMLLADGEWRSYRCAVVPAGIPHALDLAGGVHGKLFVERHGPSWTFFRSRYPYAEGEVTSFDDAATVESFQWVHEEDPTPAALAGRVDRLLGSDSQAPVVRCDARIQLAVDLICREPERNFSRVELAARVGLSPSRFLHLFRQHTGVPYRRFRNWKRMVAAVQSLHAADNMTRAALDAGFADATHFSHSFRHTFGVSPAPVFRRIERFEVGCGHS
jgi:AraC-like DNA-binding protein